MALSDSCFEFLWSVEAVAASLAEAVHHYSAPGYALAYDSEIDALRRACAAVKADPYDPKAGALLLELAVSVMTFHDTHPLDKVGAIRRKKEMRRLIRLMQSELNDDDAISVPAIVSNVVAETQYTPVAVRRMKELLSKLGASAYDAAIKIITDIGSATVKKILGL
jgi:hypothetical protein